MIKMPGETISRGQDLEEGLPADLLSNSFPSWELQGRAEEIDNEAGEANNPATPGGD